MARATRHGLDLLLAQYRSSPNLIKYIQMLISEFNEVERVMEDIRKKRLLSIARGMQLDYIADIVGTSRTIYGADPMGYFGYYGHPQSSGIDVGIFKSEDDKGSGDLILTDAQLRARIRARIIKTMGCISIEDLLEYCDLILGRDLDIEITEGTASVHLRYHGTLSPADKALLAVIIVDVKVVGVAMTLEDDAGNIILQYDSKDYPVRA